MRTFGDPYYNSDNDNWKADIHEVSTRDEDDEYQQEHERVNNNLANIETILDETISVDSTPNWVIFAVYVALYSRPNKTMHINRVRGMIHSWLEVTTYRDLVEAEIIDIDQIIHNYHN